MRAEIRAGVAAVIVAAVCIGLMGAYVLKHGPEVARIVTQERPA